MLSHDDSCDGVQALNDIQIVPQILTSNQEGYKCKSVATKA
jgi:hypothetical protein